MAETASSGAIRAGAAFVEATLRDNTGPGLWRLVADRGPRPSALRVLILVPRPTVRPHKGTVRQYGADVNRQAGPGHPAILRLTWRWRRS